MNPVENEDVYRKHSDCRCTVEYDPGGAKRFQNVHNKEWKTAEERAKMEARKTEAKPKKPKLLRIGKKELARLSHQIATDFPTLTPEDGIMPYENRNHYYEFEVIEFGSYRFHCKVAISGNEDYLLSRRNAIRKKKD